MICVKCAKAADSNNKKKHCKGAQCDCQHRPIIDRKTGKPRV